MKIAFAVFSGALLIGILVAFSSGNAPAPEIAVHFSPTGNERLLQKTIAAEISAAKSTIVVAMYHFSSFPLAKTLASVQKEKGIAVRLLLDKRQAENSQPTATEIIDILRKAGAEIKMVDLQPTSAEKTDGPRFHHKFCVIDGMTVITGSYNWTNMGDSANHENILIIRDPATAKQYQEVFDRQWKETK